METAKRLRQIEENYKDQQRLVTRDAKARAVVAHNRQVSEAIGKRFDRAQLHAMVVAMRRAAESGEHSHLVLRFPSDICTDGGRGINSAQVGWGTTLRGEAADVYCFWEEQLKPLGFLLTAQVLNFPGGKPGDIGLTVTW
jgi:hypothetical protein